MALNINMGAKTHQALFSKLLTSTEDTNLLAEVVHSAHAQFTVGFWTISMTYAYDGINGSSEITLPVTTTALMKGGVEPAILEACRKALTDMLLGAKNHIMSKLNAQLDKPKKPVASMVETATSIDFEAEMKKSIIGQVTEATQGQAKSKFMSSAAAKPHVKVDVHGNVKPAPLPGKVKLAQALAVGQKVFGTSEGSIYTTVAVNDRVKLAMRLTKGSVSIRAEGNPNAAEVSALNSIGMTGHASEPKYWSMHLKTAEIPAARVVGAMLMSIGIDFDDQLTKMKDLTYED